MVPDASYLSVEQLPKLTKFDFIKLGDKGSFTKILLKNVGLSAMPLCLIALLGCIIETVPTATSGLRCIRERTF